MAVYNYAAVADATVAFEKGITLQQGRALRDNPIALAGGAADAPRISIRALDRLAAGDVVKSTQSGDTETYIRNVGFMQFGQVRAVMTRSAGGTAKLDRIRNGAITTLVAEAAADFSADVGVIPGDTLFFRGYLIGAGSTFTASVRTSGADLWPAPTNVITDIADV